MKALEIGYFDVQSFVVVKILLPYQKFCFSLLFVKIKVKVFIF